MKILFFSIFKPYRGFRNTLIVVFFITSAGLVNRNLGNFSRELNDLLAFLSLSIFISLFHPLKHSKNKYRDFFILFLPLFFIFLIFTKTQQPIIKLLLFTLLIGYFYLIIRSNEKSRFILPILFITSTLYTIFIAYYINIPVIWNSCRLFSYFYTRNTTRIVGENFSFGPTASGISILILFFIFLISYVILTKKRDWRFIFNIFCLSFLLNVTYLIVQYPILKIIKNSSSPLNKITSIDIQIVFIFFLSLPVYLLMRKEETLKNISLSFFPEKKYLSYLILSVLLIFSSTGLLYLWPIKKSASSEILLYDSGYMNWAKPEKEKYGLGSWGMFGMLPDFLKNLGFFVKKDRTISSKSLENVDILVIINLNQKLTLDEKEEIWKYARRGGSLLCLGDHTGLEGIREPFNDLLQAVKIEFNFDCGHYLRNYWKNDFEFVNHPINWGINSDHDTGISVGASLKVSPMVQPVIIGKYAFSDIGNPNDPKNAYLGDRKYNDGESLGDIILVAESNYGKGKVLVFGDTSSFQNLSIGENYVFAENIFNYLSSKNSWIQKNIILISFFLLIGGLIFLFCASKNQTVLNYLIIPLTILTSLGVVNLLNPKLSSHVTTLPNIAWIDDSHMERNDIAINGEKSIMGLYANLIKNAFTPLILYKFSDAYLLNGNLFVSIAPAKKFSDKDISSINRYLQKGGTVILAVGHEEKNGSKSLLDFVGLDISSTPLGPVPPDMNNQGINFVNAWPIKIEKGNNSPKIICQYENKIFNFPLIVSKNIGSGRFFLISDSDFFFDNNLESPYYYVEKNIHFLESLLAGDI